MEKKTPRRAMISMVTLALGAALLLAACPSEDGPPTPSSASPSPTPRATDDGTIHVYFHPDDAEPTERSAYVAAARRGRDGDGIEERLRTALEELVQGPTSKERDEGLGSTFSDETARLVERVEVVDGKARVDLRDFRELIPQVSTSYARVYFQFSLNLTVFQFAEIEGVQYTIDGDCTLYWEFLQAGECRPPVTREAWDKAWNSLN